jgi:hypothetical protein
MPEWLQRDYRQTIVNAALCCEESRLLIDIYRANRAGYSKVIEQSIQVIAACRKVCLMTPDPPLFCTATWSIPLENPVSSWPTIRLSVSNTDSD